ncbi:putative P450 monooxygenase [Saccharata proteae CBS 121410]|uniref:P450 monooxygenase n=1 Tax=Saccharata proteae CBS 121410 TaxID=1314787 RepID=A0A9P4HZW1_9PEZI|nr:putative P450 monooxygenase [Saccharata proteae CBS 121410]
MFPIITVAIISTIIYALHHLIIQPLFLSPLHHIPGPKLYALTKWRLAYEDLRGRRTRTIHDLHLHYGPAIRIGPSEIHFNSLAALRSIYGAGSAFGRTGFYRMFDVYGCQNLFTFHSGKEHAERKKLLAHAYSKSAILRGPGAEMIEEKIGTFMEMLGREKGTACEVFKSLHYYSLDTITAFLYGDGFGGTAAMEGNLKDRALLDDILRDPDRRRLTWFATHLPGLTAWLYALNQYAVFKPLVRPLLPMKPPTTYTAIRNHALQSYQRFEASKHGNSISSETHPTIMTRLYASHPSQNPSTSPLSSLSIASELADHLLAGISTTADTLTFLLFQLSLPANAAIQERLVKEVRSLPPSALTVNGEPDTRVPSLSTADNLPIFNAIVKETLRLFAPLPASEPRVCFSASPTVDGYRIPSGTVVGMQPYSLHREEAVFREPEVWRPERWLEEGRSSEMERWWWAFSSGARGLATAEMALVPAIYGKYRTRVKAGFEGVSPGCTSRFEVFHDERFGKVEEHTCWLDFIEK